MYDGVIMVIVVIMVIMVIMVKIDTRWHARSFSTHMYTDISICITYNLGTDTCCTEYIQHDTSLIMNDFDLYVHTSQLSTLSFFKPPSQTVRGFYRMGLDHLIIIMEVG